MLVDLRHRAEFAVLLLIVLLLRMMPLSAATALSAFIWRMVAPKLHRHRRALANLAMAMPELSPDERERIARAMWANLGRVMAETLLLDRVLAQKDFIEFERPDLIARYKNKMGPLVVGSLHMGNWEILVRVPDAIESKPAGVYRLVENPYVERYLKKKRQVLYPGGLFARSSKEEGINTVLGVANHVRKGCAVGMLADLVDWKGAQVPFFGHPMWASTAPAWLARRAGARLWVGRGIRIGTQSRFRLAFKEIKVPRTTDAEADIRSITAAIQREFENWIRENPDQWMWSNKRWKVEDMPPEIRY
jgi:KDO2-lipid IV(A) lauroyltransferase